ncbi:MAG TPA: HAMP domain-containing histidine kinase [Ruminococcus bromii]|uniref:sensor histidine kinase n=1 Tax=Ruminococcus bromii TaxID=40518 RepID=UPI0026F32D46|nr:HAMP domain-containing sensor histidine kinase [Ruminococcus bromii]HJI85676.1 HAMP domain-containing histidine kinase [Ruminococcus bromii]
MKSRYIKRRKKFHYIIISVTIIVCLLGTVFTSLAILNSSKDLFVANAENELKTKMNDVENSINSDLNSDFNNVEGLLNEDIDKADTYYEVTDSSREYIASTDNVLTVYCYDISKKILQKRDYIRLDVLKNLLTDDEYNEICKYLKTATDDDGSYYLLVFDNYYSTEKYGCVPSRLEVVKSNNNIAWAVQDKKIKQYDFDLSKSGYVSKDELSEGPLQSDGMHRQIIDKDFFFGKNKPEISVESVEKIFEDNDINSEIYDKPVTVNNGLLKYYVIFGDVFSVSQSHMSRDFASPISSDVVDDDGNVVYETIIYGNYNFNAVKEINLLDDCLWKFITVFAVAFTIMAVVITVEIFSWKDFKRRTAQEETRLEMTNAIAHNLKTPLFVIGGFAENLKNEEDTEKKLHNIEIIQQQTEEMDILIHRMLDLSRFDSPALKLNCEVFDFKPFIEKILENYYVHTEHEIIFIYNSKAKIKADPAMLKTVLENLIDNAEKYSDYGSDITINVSDDVLSISNQCSSFDRENLSKLWQPYFRAAKGDNKSGSGIGLSIVKSALEMHGFKYKAEFENGIITFKFRFTSLD